MNVSPTPQLENHVKQKVATGMYNSVSEVIKDMKTAALRRDIQEGLDELEKGEGTPLDMNAIKFKARRYNHASDH